MRSIADFVNLKPIDEKLLTEHPEFNKIAEDMEGTTNLTQDKREHVFAVFHRASNLSTATVELLKVGFSARQIATFTSHDGNFLDHSEALIESKIGEGAMLGIIFGGILGALLGAFGVINLQATDMIGVFHSFFNGVVAAVITGMIFGVLGAMIGRLIPEYETESYATSLPEGYILMLVKDTSRESLVQAQKILRAAGGVVLAQHHLKILATDSKSADSPSGTTSTPVNSVAF